jgi:hypothetical protein
MKLKSVDAEQPERCCEYCARWEVRGRNIWCPSIEQPIFEHLIDVTCARWKAEPQEIDDVTA